MTPIQSKTCVVLVRPQGPINIGLVCRAMGNAGISDLRLVTPLCAVPSDESRMFAHHAQNILEACRIYPSLPEAVADCDMVVGTTARDRREEADIVSPYELPHAVRDVRQLALVFGNESDGLSREEFLACDTGVHLETPGPYASYNLSHAVAITLFVLGTATSDTAHVAAPAAPRLTHRETERLFDFWSSALSDSGYFRRTDPARFAPKLRRLLQRLALTVYDANLLWGMLAHFRSPDPEKPEFTQSPPPPAKKRK